MPRIFPRKPVAQIWNDLQIFEGLRQRLQLGALGSHPLYSLHIRADKPPVSHTLRFFRPGPPLRHHWARGIFEELRVKDGGTWRRCRNYFRQVHVVRQSCGASVDDLGKHHRLSQGGHQVRQATAFPEGHSRLLSILVSVPSNVFATRYSPCYRHR